MWRLGDSNPRLYLARVVLKPSQLNPQFVEARGIEPPTRWLQTIVASLGTCAPIEGPEVFILLRHGPRAYRERSVRIELLLLVEARHFNTLSYTSQFGGITDSNRHREIGNLVCYR